MQPIFAAKSKRAGGKDHPFSEKDQIETTEGDRRSVKKK